MRWSRWRIVIGFTLLVFICGCAPGPKLATYVAPDLSVSQVVTLKGHGSTYITVVDNHAVQGGFLESIGQLGGKEVTLSPGRHNLTITRTRTIGAGPFARLVKNTWPVTYEFEAGHEYTVGPDNFFVPWTDVILKNVTTGEEYLIHGDGDDDEEDDIYAGQVAPLNPNVQGPTYDEIDKEGPAIEVEFDDNGAPIATTDGQPPTGFIIAGEDRVFYPAQARIISHDTVRVWSEQVPKPVAVRMSADTNLVNAKGGPAEAFHSDKWDPEYKSGWFR